MASSVDILVLGATGFTGRLVTRYLHTHPQRASFRLGIAARSKAKLDELTEELALGGAVTEIIVDVLQPDSVADAVSQARVVINTVGPFWRWGTPVVQACVEYGVHYVDITGEAPWIRDMIAEFDDEAKANGTVVVPSCGQDSIPADLSAFLANKALKELNPHATLAESTTAMDYKGGISGGTLSTIVTMFEDVPAEKLAASSKAWALSPLRGAPRRPHRLVYRLPYTPIIGGIFLMAGSDTAVVERSWGLAEEAARAASGAEGEVARRRAYGPRFSYTEFMATSGMLTALLTSFSIALGALLMRFVPPFRALVNYFAGGGAGPSDDAMTRGGLVATNISFSDPASTGGDRTVVRSVVTCRGDPGYAQTALMISECALALVLQFDALPPLAQRGGLLTPATAFGDVLVERLRATGTFDFEYGRHLVGRREGKKKA